MDAINEITVLEEDVKDVNEKCKRVNCVYLYDALVATFKTLHTSETIELRFSAK
jgi:hypothetical protein